MVPNMLTCLFLILVVSVAVNAQLKRCTTGNPIDACGRSQVCVNNICILTACSQTDDDYACNEFNSTTYCEREGGQCINRTAGLGSSCLANIVDNSCVNPFICDPRDSKCADPSQIVQSFWENNRSWIIAVIVVVLVLGCCACFCVCFVLKKGLAAFTKKSTDSQGPESQHNLANVTNDTPPNAFQPTSQPQSYAPQTQEPYPPQSAPTQAQSYPPQSLPQDYPPQSQGQAYPPSSQNQSYPPQSLPQAYPPQAYPPTSQPLPYPPQSYPPQSS